MAGQALSSSPHFVRKRLREGIAWYVYAWRGGPRVLRSDDPKKPKLFSSDWVKIQAAETKHRTPSTDRVGGALTKFRQSQYWQELADSTKRTWGDALDRVGAKWGKVPLAIFDDPRMKPKTVAWRNTMSTTPRTADISVAVLSRFLDWAELEGLLETLRRRPGKAGVQTVLVNSYGKPWTGDGINSSFHDARGRANGGAGIWHVEQDGPTGEERRTQKRLHDLRGTFATRIMTHPTANLNNREVADIMGWSPEQVDQIRKRYVDDSAIVVDLTRRLGGGV